MKRNLRPLIVLSSILLLISLIGCRKNTVVDNNQDLLEGAEPTTGLSEEENQEKIMRDFRNTIESNNEPFEIVRFIDENIDHVLEDCAVEMIDQLEVIQKRDQEDYSEKLFAQDYQEILLNLPQEEPMELFLDNSLLEEIENIKLKELLDRIIEGKYKLMNIEENIYPVIAYEELKIYNEHLPKEMIDYIGIRAIDSNNPAALDDGLTIGFDELADRIIKKERYIKTYPEGVKKEELLRLYGRHLRYYMQGLDNTPIYDYETDIINNEVLKNYKKTSQIKDTVTSRIIGEYLGIIEENNFKIDESVFSQITRLYNDAIGSIENYK